MSERVREGGREGGRETRERKKRMGVEGRGVGFRKGDRRAGERGMT